MSITRTFEGWRVGMEFVNSLIYTYMIVVYCLLFLLGLSLIFGTIGSQEITFALEFNTLNSPFYKLGIFSERYTLSDGSSEDEIVIGLFFVNISIVFWKDVNLEEDL
jgi:hypothetical protein